nr:MAG TPA: hypothetical protein [Caudoviricetes sp.]
MPLFYTFCTYATNRNNPSGKNRDNKCRLWR